MGLTQIATPKSKRTHAIVSFSQHIVLAPSALVSQKAAVAVCTCADCCFSGRSTNKQLTCRAYSMSFFCGKGFVCLVQAKQKPSNQPSFFRVFPLNGLQNVSPSYSLGSALIVPARRTCFTVQLTAASLEKYRRRKL